MTAILANIGTVVGDIVDMVVSTLGSLVANDYFLVVITLCIATAVIGIILKFFKSFGLKRGGKRRGR